MKKYIIALACLALLPCQALQASAIISEDITVAANGTAPATVTNTGSPANGATFDYGVRERTNPGQTSIRTASFIEFDISSITAADIADPTFSAIFEIEHVGHLNNVNTGFDLSLGAVNSAWDTTANLPPFALAAGATPLGVLLTDVQLVSGSQMLSLDITSLVLDWYNGVTPNNGLVLFGTPDPMTVPASNGTNNGQFSQASFLQGAAIVHSVVPEPSSFSMICLVLVGLIGLRRRA